VAQLLSAPPTEAWLAALHKDPPETRELYRDPVHDFLLLAHTEQAGLYRPPHDHGRGWVIYAVQRGEQEMSTYRRVHDLRGNAVLVKRENYVLRPGDIRVFLPGDIHDTHCKAGPLTLLRFTSRDFKKEEVTRYPDPRGTR
jgi:predicted metal-dependent enzyme (double-stranded beta helix superfamily)